MKLIKKIKPFHTDKRGSMFHLLTDDSIKIKSVLLITCKKNSVRANHWHKHDTHYVYMLKGRMKYYYKDLNKIQSKKKNIIVKAGEIVFTPSKVAHSMKFLEDSIFITLSTEIRNQKEYEKDTVKINLM